MQNQVFCVTDLMVLEWVIPVDKWILDFRIFDTVTKESSKGARNNNNNNNNNKKMCRPSQLRTRVPKISPRLLRHPRQPATVGTAGTEVLQLSVKPPMLPCH